MAGTEAAGHPEWQLPTALQLHILSLLPPNERVLRGRLVCRDAAAAACRDPRQRTAIFSQPLPPESVPWALAAGTEYAYRQPLPQQVMLLEAAASSGSEVNLEVAWALLQPSIFPELLQDRNMARGMRKANLCYPGEAAVKAGHPQLLHWLLCRCPAYVEPEHVVTAAARNCDLAGLQAVWEALKGQYDYATARHNGTTWGKDNVDAIYQEWQQLGRKLYNVAAVSHMADAEAKMEWVRVTWGGQCSPKDLTAAVAGRSGDIGRLQAFRDRGLSLDGHDLWSALEFGSLAVVQWLVDEAGCKLPAPEEPDEADRWKELVKAAARSVDGLAKTLWQQQRGGPPLERVADALSTITVYAVCGRRLQDVQHLLSAFGPDEVLQVGPPGKLQATAAYSGSTEVAECLRQVGLEFAPAAYEKAAEGGRLAMVRWLAHEAGVPAAGAPLKEVVKKWRGWGVANLRNKNLLQAVQLLVDAGCRGWDAKEVLCCAAARGDLALVQYLSGQQPGYRMGRDMVAAAAEGGCVALLEWVVERACSLVIPRDAAPYIIAAKRGGRGTLVALRRLGVPWGPDERVVGTPRHAL